MMVRKSKMVGNILINLGLVSLIVGLLSAFAKSIKEMMADLQTTTQGITGEQMATIQTLPESIGTIVQALVDLLVVFRESPVWLVLIVIGIGLILLGLWLSPEQPRQPQDTGQAP